ncbi:CDP-glycerol glycerophosphotransferase family protein [Modestobacter roseus]|uniref:CDP-glycerol:poly(Glycerophosphate) glycerophosphotransferase n=1 Tax=Modestobacter roseus TaxID=1181884 RepID=A0A562IMP1_9ACTN|nr:CDP-glycerol glycerophosphotransferase family protein [Modestobacter roseus]MQA32455.1 CDP-glycerol glycerophosphotransferase family protein [Modestobacter roseus]TWH72279.1 CDP-glycerol:poly(glycerophosphate) glycerophosphotransferase [Modestobacter roseus]
MKVVFNSFGGRYNDNPRAVYEALVARGAEMDAVWLARPELRGDFPAGVSTVETWGPDARAAVESADVIVSNDGISREWDKDPATTYLQTWHGTPLKRLHRDAVWAPEGRLELVMRDVARWDVLLSPNAASTPHLRSAFGFTGPVHETGYPRNDVLNAPDRDARRARVRAELGIADGVTAVLYAPTWRDDLVLSDDGPKHTFPVDLGDLARGLGADSVLLVRLHAMVSDRLVVQGPAPLVDVSRYPDISELYLAADVLVTDYSSTMFDFAVTGKPIVHFTYDLEHYRDDLRGFYFDLAEIAPGPLLTTSEQVLAAIAGLRERPWEPTERYERFQDTFCSLEDGAATERVLQLLFPPDGRPAARGALPANDEPRR